MNLWIRLLRVIITSFFRRRLGFLDESVLGFAVSPGDLDVNIHMNNARYLAIMDLGRADLLMRTGMWPRLFREKIQPVLGATMVRYRRPLAPFQRFTLRSRLVGWDEKWFYIEHRIESRGTLACLAIVKGVFTRPQGRVAPIDIAGMVGWSGTPPTLPAWVKLWQDFETGIEKEPAITVVKEDKRCAR